MIPWFSKLKWQSYSSLIKYRDMPFTELDKFADYIFDNGVSIRVSTGKMALTKYSHPYEMNIKYPHGAEKQIGYMNKHDLIIQMEKLNRL